MTEDEKELRTLDVIETLLKAVPSVVSAAAWVLIAGIVGWTTVNTTANLAGRTTSAKFQILIDMKATKELGVGGPIVLTGAGIAYVRRRKRLSALKRSLVANGASKKENVSPELFGRREK